MKRKIKLTESSLCFIITESVKQVLSEYEYNNAHKGSLDESISFAINSVLNEGTRNQELRDFLETLIANGCRKLYDYGDLNTAKSAIKAAIDNARLTREKKNEYLNGKYDFNGIMGAKDFVQLGKIISQIYLGYSGLGVGEFRYKKRWE